MLAEGDKNMRKMVAAMGALVILAGCQASPVSTQTSTATYLKEWRVDSAFRSETQRQVAARLKDPESARFGPIRAVSRIWNGSEELVVCGWVNSKNSFGGYTGQTPYIGKFHKNRDFELVAMGDASQTSALLVLGACETAGIPINARPR